MVEGEEVGMVALAHQVTPLKVTGVVVTMPIHLLWP